MTHASHDLSIRTVQYLISFYTSIIIITVLQYMRHSLLHSIPPQKEILIFPVQLTTSRIDSLTRLILTLAICDDHTYIHYIYIVGGSMGHVNIVPMQIIKQWLRFYFPSQQVLLNTIGEAI